jgi:hypothetical protein
MIICPHGIKRDVNDSYSKSASSSLDGDTKSTEADRNNENEDATATLHLVRFVNGMPLLDGIEAHSCGLVHGLANKSVWGQFGLNVTQRSTIAQAQYRGWTPTFDLQDSAQVAPFIERQSNNHLPLSENVEFSSRGNFKDSDESSWRGRTVAKNGCKRDRRASNQELLLPAHLRLGHVLVIVRIWAAPSSLPLPTLCKVSHLRGKHLSFRSATQK